MEQKQADGAGLIKVEIDASPRLRIAGTYATQDGVRGVNHHACTIEKKRGDCSGPPIFYRENIGNTFTAFASADSDPAEVAKWQEVALGPPTGIGVTNAIYKEWWREKRERYPNFPWADRGDLPSVWEYFYPGVPLALPGEAAL